MIIANVYWLFIINHFGYDLVEFIWCCSYFFSFMMITYIFFTILTLNSLFWFSIISEELYFFFPWYQISRNWLEWMTYLSASALASFSFSSAMETAVGGGGRSSIGTASSSIGVGVVFSISAMGAISGGIGDTELLSMMKLLEQWTHKHRNKLFIHLRVYAN